MTTAEEYFDIADDLLCASNYNDAIRYLTLAIKLNPKFADAYEVRGECYEQIEEYDKAAADYTKLIELIPDNPELYYRRAKFYEKIGEYDKASVDYTKIIELRHSYNDYLERAQFYEAIGEYDKAVTDYTKTIKLDPEYVCHYFCRANVYEKIGEYDKAVADYTKAIEIFPHMQTYRRRAHFYEKIGEYDKAAADYTSAIKVDFDIKFDYEEPELYLDRARFYRKIGEYDKAAADYTKVVKLMPDDPCTYFNRAQCYEKIGQYNKALKDINEAIGLHSSNLYYSFRDKIYSALEQMDNYNFDDNEYEDDESDEYDEYEDDEDDEYDEYNIDNDYEKDKETLSKIQDYMNGGFYYCERKEFNRAIEDFNKAIELNPNYANAYHNRGICYYELKQNDEAIEDCIKAIELDPNNNEYQAQKEKLLQVMHDYVNIKSEITQGLEYLLLKQHEEAIKYFTKAIDNENIDLESKIEALKLRGCSYDALEQFEKAIEDYSSAIELDPDNAEIYGNRVYCYMHMQKYDKAIDDCNKVLELDSDRADKFIQLKDNMNKMIELSANLEENLTTLEECRANKDFLEKIMNYWENKQYQEVIDYCTEFIKSNPDYAEAYKYRGQGYYMLGTFTDIDNKISGIKDYMSGKRAYKDKPSVEVLEYFEKAISDCSKAIELNPDDSSIYVDRGNCYENVRQFDSAIEDYKKAIELSDDDSEIDELQQKVDNILKKQSKNDKTTIKGAIHRNSTKGRKLDL